MEEEMVSVWDCETEMMSDIPARELAHGMIAADLMMDDGEVQRCFVDATQLEPSPLKHPPFDEATEARIRKLAKAFAEHIDPMQVDQWRQNFRRDENPDKEIRIWEEILRCYKILSRSMNIDERDDVYRLILSFTMNTRSKVLLVTSIRTLPKTKANEIIDWLSANFFVNS